MATNDPRYYRDIINKILQEAKIPAPDKKALNKARRERMIRQGQLPEWWKFVTVDGDELPLDIHFSMPASINIDENHNITTLHLHIDLNGNAEDSWNPDDDESNDDYNSDYSSSGLYGNIDPPLSDDEIHLYDIYHDNNTIEEQVNQALVAVGFKSPGIMFSESGMQDQEHLHFDEEIAKQIVYYVKKIYKI